MEERVILLDLPTSVRGFVFLDEDGNPVIVLNARLTREINRKTYGHEKRHIACNQMTDAAYNEYGEDKPP